MVIDSPVVLSTEYQQVGWVRPVVTHMPEEGAGSRHALTSGFLAQSFVLVIAGVNEGSFLQRVGLAWLQGFV